jgi:hypothetical protein
MAEMEVDIGGFSSADLGGGHERREEAGGEDPMRELMLCESMNLASSRRACWRGGWWLERARVAGAACTTSGEALVAGAFDASFPFSGVRWNLSSVARAMSRRVHKSFDFLVKI